MGKITLTGITLSGVPAGSQTVNVSWRKQSDPDLPSSYIQAPDATIDASGVITAPLPYELFVPDEIIVVKCVNSCGGSTNKIFTVCSMITIVQSGILGSCPAGYTLSEDGSYCYYVQTQPPTITQVGYCVAPNELDVWNDSGSRVYKVGHDAEIDWLTNPAQYTAMNNVPQWQSTGVAPPVGVINRYAVWIDSDCNGSVDSLVSGQQVTLAVAINNPSTARTVYVGVSGDNNFELVVNGVAVAKNLAASSSAFKIFHIFPVTLVNGTNYFNVVGTGDGSTNDHVAMVIYDNTELEIVNATDDSELNILWHSRQIIGQQIEVATCPVGWNLDVSGGVGNYVCKRVITTSPS